MEKRNERSAAIKMSTRPEIQTEEEVEVAVEQMTEEESQVVVHCVCSVDAYYRIWPTTFLVEHGTGRQAKLVTAFNVSFYPGWTEKSKGQKFTLIFEGLSRSCVVFDLKEIIPESGGFEVNGIVRNSTDVYTVEIG
jgi:hypothetical protein